MQLPNFQDFLDSINQTALQAVIEESVGIRIIQTDSLLNKENFSALMSEVIRQSVDASTSISLLYLRTYHEWLQRQFDQTPDLANE